MVRRHCGFSEEWLVNPVGLSGRLALWLLDTITMDILFSSYNISHTRVGSGALTTPAFITFIYGPISEEERLLCWQEIHIISCNTCESWSCIGDFNDILSQFEKSSGTPKVEKNFEFQIFCC